MEEMEELQKELTSALEKFEEKTGLIVKRIKISRKWEEVSSKDWSDADESYLFKITNVGVGTTSRSINMRY